MLKKVNEFVGYGLKWEKNLSASCLVAARVSARDVARSLSPSFSLPFDLDV